MSAVGVNVPARRTVSEWTSASTIRRRNPANASQGRPSSASAASASSTYRRRPSAAQLPQQVLLARIPPVERADADAGAARDRRDRGVGIGDEDLPGGREDPLVVLRRLAAAAAQCAALHARRLPLEQIIPFRYNGTEQFVPFGRTSREGATAHDRYDPRHHDHALPHRHPAGRPRRPPGPARPRALARRAPRRRRLRRQPVVRPLARRPLAERLRLARGRGPDQRLPAVHDRDRRPARPLPPRPLARAGRAAAHRDPRLARIDRRVPRHHRPADRSPEPRRRPGDAFHLVIPSMPGYGFSGPTREPRLEPTTGSPRPGSS